MANNSSGRLLVSEVHEGDTLILVHLAGFSRRVVSEQEVTVSKITKTRLVLGVAYASEFWPKRVILRDGEVTNRFEGNQNTYVRLFTPDDEDLADIREGGRIDKLKGEARGAVDHFRNSP